MLVLTRWVLSHKLIVTIFWITMTVVAFAAVSRATNALSVNFNAPGQEAYETNLTVARSYGLDTSKPPIVLVATVPPGMSIDSPAVSGQLSGVIDQVDTAVPGARVVSYLSTHDPSFISHDGRTTYILVSSPSAAQPTGFDSSPALDTIQHAVSGVQVGGAPVHVSGIAALSNSERGGGVSVLVEVLIGSVGALIVLAFVFGSFISLTPLVMAAVAIPNTFLLVWGLTTITEISVIVEFLVALIGLGVAIDYSLLIVVRWREERAAGYANAEAVERAMETAGHSVVFSGTTVAIGLLAMVTLPIPALRSIGYGGMLIPVVSVLVALTLLPVILATIGPRLDWPRFRSEAHVSRAWSNWAHFVVRRRWLALLAAVLVLGALLIPAARLNPGNPSVDSLATTGDAYDGLVALERSGIGTGPLTPIEVLVTEGSPPALETRLASIDGVRTVVPQLQASRPGGSSSLLTVIPSTDVNSDGGRAILSRVDQVAHQGPELASVGGAAAANRDSTDAIYGNFPLMIAVLTVITFLLLVRAFRSIILPLKAVVLNLVSVGATWGILSLVWQSGYGSREIWGVQATGAVTSWVPLMVFAFLFGLSMDYEVFILARMREEYDRTNRTDEAVIEGIGRTGRLVTGGALILFLSFISLSTAPSNDVKMVATGLAAGILLDATVVRALLVPAAVSLMGAWNWWLPKPMVRLLRVAHAPTRDEVMPAVVGVETE